MDKRQRIMADYDSGMTTREIAAKYGLSTTYLNRVRRQALGVLPKRDDNARLSRLEERVKTLETLIDRFFRERLKRAGLG